MQRHNAGVMVLLVALVFSVSLAAGFGYAETTTEKTIGVGGDTAFTVYVFGENGTLHVDRLQAPTDWGVTVAPETVSLPPRQDYVHVRSENEYKRMRPITISVDTPVGVDPGTYDVSFTVEELVGQTPTEQSDLVVHQTQPFTFHVTVAQPRTVTEHVRHAVGTVSQSLSQSGGGIISTLSNRIAEEQQQLRDEEDTQTQPDQDTQPHEGTNDSKDTPPASNMHQQGNTPTGNIASRLPNAGTLMNALMFVLIWGAVITYILRRRSVRT